MPPVEAIDDSITAKRAYMAAGGVGFLLVLALFMTAPILWLVERGAKQQPSPAPWAPPPPGCYADPANPYQTRWWDEVDRFGPDPAVGSSPRSRRAESHFAPTDSRLAGGDDSSSRYNDAPALHPKAQSWGVEDSYPTV